MLAIVPGLALTLLLAAKRLADRDALERTLVAEAALSAATQVDNFLGRHVAGIRSAAEAIELDARPSSDRAGQWLLRYHPIYPDFLTMLVADSTGNVLAASKGQSGDFGLFTSTSVRIPDRDYFREPMRTGKDFVSGAFRGRGLGTDPIVAISSPIQINGKIIGIVEGSLDLRAFQRLESNFQKLLNSHVVITDESDTVIFAHPDTGYRVLEVLTGLPLASFSPASRAGDITDRVSSAELLVSRVNTERGWSIYILRPKYTLRQLLGSIWWVALGWLAISALTAMVLAWALARRVVQPLSRLTNALDTYESGRRSPFRSLKRLPDEYISIFRHLHAFVVRLSARHSALKRALAQAEGLQSELREVLKERDEEIANRTRELAAANTELKALSRTDPLTRLPNRRSLDEVSAIAWAAAAREGQPLCVLMIDVDFFKSYNDRYGHQAGDVVLRQVAQTLPACLNRPEDFAARYGGEEFVVVLGNTEAAGGRLVAECIRARIAGLHLPHQDSPHHVVTVSVGVCVASPVNGETLEAALKRADALLYEAKTQGRNCVCANTQGSVVPISHRTA